MSCRLPPQVETVLPAEPAMICDPISAYVKSSAINRQNFVYNKVLVWLNPPNSARETDKFHAAELPMLMRIATR